MEAFILAIFVLRLFSLFFVTTKTFFRMFLYFRRHLAIIVLRFGFLVNTYGNTFFLTSNNIGERRGCMSYSPQEMQLLTQVLPNVAAQLRSTLSNMHTALSAGNQPENCILRQSYYRLLRTVTNLTDAAALTENTPLPKQDTDLVEFFEALCRQAQVPLETCGLSLQFDLQPRQLIAGINREYTARIFWNLLSNAAKFTSPGGTIHVSLQHQGRRAVLQVSDTGCGIAPELLDTVYDRILHFRRMDPLPHGLGLGLSLCRCFAQRQGGSLLLHSIPDKGTRVVVSLPAERCGISSVQDLPFHYAGGFQPVMMELSDALPYQGFQEKHLD